MRHVFTIQRESSSGFLHEFRFQTHLTEAWDRAINIMIRIHKANTFDLGPDLHRRRSAFDLEVLDDDDGISIPEDIANAVPDNECVIGRNLGLGPNMTTFRAIQ